MGNLAMQIRHLDCVAIDETQSADSRAGEIGRCGTSQASSSDEQDLGVFDM